MVLKKGEHSYFVSSYTGGEDSTSRPNSSSKKVKRSEEKVKKSSPASENVEDKIKEECKKSPETQFANTNNNENDNIDVDELLAKSEDENANDSIVHIPVMSEDPPPSFKCLECRKTIEDRVLDHYTLFRHKTLRRSLAGFIYRSPL